MFARVHKPGNFVGGDNKGSSGKLFDYLDKENRDHNGLDLDEKIGFFNHDSNDISFQIAKESIDKNNKGLGKNDNKFFMLSINPSQNELKHLIKISTGKEVNSIDQLSSSDLKKVNESLQKYTRNVMDIYAKNFKRPEINTGKDLIYFAKIETRRSFKHYDKYVIENKATFNQINHLEAEKLKLNSPGSDHSPLDKSIQELKQNYHMANGKVITSGMQKDGLQMHVHVVVSRNDAKQKTKLSPMSKSRGGTQQLNGAEVMQGFNHEDFKTKSGQAFNDMFSYTSMDSEQYTSKTSKAKSNSDDRSPGTALAGNLKGKAISQVKSTLTQGHFKTEMKVISNAKNIIKLITNPKGAAIDLARKKIRDILMGGLDRD